MQWINLLLIFIPIAFGLDHWHADPFIVFIASALAIMPLAMLMEKATDALASYLGPSYGGLLSATMGNAPELIIGISALNHGLIDMLKGSIAGSVLGTLLFGVGLSMFVGGLGRPFQTFDRDMVSINSSLLMLGTFSMIIPAVFDFTTDVDQEISLHISVTLLLIYVASIIHTLVRDGRNTDSIDIPPGHPVAKPKTKETPEWSRNTALAILAAVAVALAVVSDLLTGSIQPAADAMGLNPVFAGVFLLAMVGNIPQYMNSVSFAHKNKMTLALSINLGSTTQLVLLVAPLLVISGTLMGLKMNLLFSNFELIGVILSVNIARSLIADNRSTWFEGLLLIGVYAMLGFGFYYLPHTAAAS
ncbi:calcium/proton exchanger [Candidatus Methylospira mobilis]|uniref:Ca(2+)/H(+) antiporter n=1 Tax=Candidatus Methylospira mobilis TaxID=1808979 RepID=A0A5Q0BKI4_9GAMM|nr:calcium/proton exchanger [Candidatus Methylospira mobilis]QFY42276.1 calcium/proton exchanger [Candidatus Methylospira mobilis]WNV03302.1 calcium/proton exchanger [Candidatus Methylospira mobilis]